MEKNKDFRYLVRVCNTDLDGNKSIGQALNKIKGVSTMLANAICKTAGIDNTKKAGILSDGEVSKLDQITKDPLKFGVPLWMMNRRKDPETGKDMHLLSADLDFTKSNDIKLMKKIKCYRGMRHAFGLPSRGQRTKSNFRKSKSTGKGGSLGVKRKK
ncbi:30S ribosomal protein S13 [Candidatus Woesearchaeota archaeon]|nr:30S ribosomal protein S13 [Candidatus Woesearchaeota archaeon]